MSLQSHESDYFWLLLQMFTIVSKLQCTSSHINGNYNTDYIPFSSYLTLVTMEKEVFDTDSVIAETYCRSAGLLYTQVFRETQ